MESWTRCLLLELLIPDGPQLLASALSLSLSLQPTKKNRLLTSPEQRKVGEKEQAGMKASKSILTKVGEEEGEKKRRVEVEGEMFDH